MGGPRDQVPGAPVCDHALACITHARHAQRRPAIPIPARPPSTAAQVLLGGKDGAYFFDQKVSVSTATADGVKLDFLAAKKGERADLMLKTGYTFGRFGFNAILNTTDKVAVTASVDQVAPGLKATIMATLPDVASGKMALDWSTPHGHVKAVMGLTSSPRVDLWATTAYKNLVVGGHSG